MKSRVLVAVAVGLLLAADPPREKKSDRERIEGTWDLVSVEKNGKKDPKAAGTAEFKGDTLTVRPKGEKEQKATYKLDEAKKPRAIDIVMKDAPPNVARNLKGIYELKGNTLRLCFGPPDKDRPARFDSGQTNIVMTFKRAKR